MSAPESLCCVHAELSFGGAGYLIQRPEGNVLVDVPRFNPKLVKRIKVLPHHPACTSTVGMLPGSELMMWVSCI